MPSWLACSLITLPTIAEAGHHMIKASTGTYLLFVYTLFRECDSGWTKVEEHRAVGNTQPDLPQSHLIRINYSHQTMARATHWTQ